MSKRILSLLLVLVMMVGCCTSCFLFKKDDGTTDAPEYKQAEYNTYTSVMPSNWNELTYQDNNDTQIMSYIGSSFYDYDYKFLGNKYNEDGSINAEAIVAGAYPSVFCPRGHIARSTRCCHWVRVSSVSRCVRMRSLATRSLFTSSL